MNAATEQVISLFSGKQGAVSFTALPPLSLYIHLPWCIKKCPYCDFNSHALSEVTSEVTGEVTSDTGSSEVPEAAYIHALLKDLESALPLIWGRPIISIFLGGGTPSLFTPRAIDMLLAGVRARLKVLPGAEITLEANPGTFEAGRFAGYAQAGVNRLSIGVQSFNDAHLKALGRVHNSAQAHAAIDEAARHYSTFNLDVMYALPGQTLAQCEADVRTALSYAPPHISVYHLTLEPNTYFAKYPPTLPDEDLAYDMQDCITALTQAAGYAHYEVSAYAKPLHRSQHNQNYWTYGDYLGIGAGAHSKLSFPNKILRQVRYRSPAEYMRAFKDTNDSMGAVAQENEVNAHDVPFEFMLNALRLHEGFDAALFSERAGLPLRVMEQELQQAQQRGFISRTTHNETHRIVPTPLGQQFLNDLQALFLRDAAAKN
jgi:putative oxygen-independent coproporphyrinogen III oxidase